MTPKDLEVPPSSRRKKEAAEFIAAEAPVSTHEPYEKPKKLSLEIPPDVHRAEKSGAALRGNSMISEVVEMLRARNGLAKWPDDIVAQVVAQLEDEPAAADKARTVRSRAKRPA